MKQDVTISVDVPYGWEVTGEYRLPCLGDLYLMPCGGVVETDSTTHLYVPRIIMRRKWEWPAWLKAEWISMDACRGWWAYTSEPVQEDDGWDGRGSLHLTRPSINFTPPPCTDWRTSLRRNPNMETTT